MNTHVNPIFDGLIDAHAAKTNPDGPENAALTRDNERAVFAAKMQGDYPQEIKAGHATIRLLSITSLEVDDSPEGDREAFYQYGPFYVDDSRAIDPIKRVLESADWTELELNDAVKECRKEEARYDQ